VTDREPVLRNCCNARARLRPVSRRVALA